MSKCKYNKTSVPQKTKTPLKSVLDYDFPDKSSHTEKCKLDLQVEFEGKSPVEIYDIFVYSRNIK